MDFMKSIPVRISTTYPTKQVLLLVGYDSMRTEQTIAFDEFSLVGESCSYLGKTCIQYSLVNEMGTYQMHDHPFKESFLSFDG